jgi:hypothetical protein
MEIEKMSPKEYWRLVVERSCMANNDEVVQYWEGPISEDKQKETREDFYKRGEHVVHLRRVLPEEIALGLNVEFKGHVDDEKIPDLTLYIDAFTWLKDQVEIWGTIGSDKMTPSKILAHLIAYDYYDCMSGGCPGYRYAIYAYLLKNGNFDMGTPVYPGKDDKVIRKESDPSRDILDLDTTGWYTLQDFLDTVEKDGNLKPEEVLMKAQSLLPPLFKMLPA